MGLVSGAPCVKWEHSLSVAAPDSAFNAQKYRLSSSSVGKESACNAGDPSLIPRLGSSSGEGDRLPTPVFLGFPDGSDGKESICNVGDLCSIPVLGRSSGGGRGNPLQYSCLDRGAWQATVHGVTKNQTRLGA